MADTIDIALRYDPARRRFDLALDGRAIALDTTPATAMIIALGSDARARPDDRLPADPGPAAAEAVVALNPRRGWCGDALDTRGERLGSRLWLLIRAAASEATRRDAVRYAEEALAPLARARGLAIAVDAVRDGATLRLRARAGATAIEVRQGLAA